MSVTNAFFMVFPLIKCCVVCRFINLCEVTSDIIRKDSIINFDAPNIVWVFRFSVNLLLFPQNHLTQRVSIQTGAIISRLKFYFNINILRIAVKFSCGERIDIDTACGKLTHIIFSIPIGSTFTIIMETYRLVNRSKSVNQITGNIKMSYSLNAYSLIILIHRLPVSRIKFINTLSENFIKQFQFGGKPFVLMRPIVFVERVGVSFM